MQDKRVKKATMRLGEAAETFGTCDVFVGARVMAPWKGSQKMFPGCVKTADFERRTVAILYDDKDMDVSVKVATIRFENGAQARLPLKRKHAAGQKLKVKKKPRKLRLPAQRTTDKRSDRVGAGQEDWVLHKVIALQIVPPRAGENHYDNVDQRLVLDYQWLWAGENKPADAPFAPDRISKISLRDVLKKDAFVCGMYLVALRHFCMDVAKGGPMNAIVLANIFGKYDPIEH